MLNFFKKRKKDLRSELKKILGDYEIPSFPTAIMNVLSALRDPNFSMNQVTAHLESDPGLHVKILKTVNSAAFGLATKVKNLHHAVTMLGRSRLETIVLSQAVNRILPNVELSFFDMRHFWLMSARRASLARVLAHHLHPATQVESFTAGLLQDMALPILITVKPKEYKTILQKWNNDKNTNLPEYLIMAISDHHTQDVDSQIEPALVLISHIRGESEKETADILVSLCTEKYGMVEDTINELVHTAFKDADELSQMLK